VKRLVAGKQHIDASAFSGPQQRPVLQSRPTHVRRRYNVMMPKQSAQSMIEILIEQDLQEFARLR
jgi:hypothetical protein